MKKIFLSVAIVLSVIFVGLTFYVQPWTDIKINNSILDGNKGASSERVSLTANQLYISDSDDFSSEMLKRFEENDFQNVRFSFDENGYPEKLNITVYSNKLSQRLHKQSFCIVATKTSDNPVHYDYSIE